jgi:proline racemase
MLTTRTVSFHVPAGSIEATATIENGRVVQPSLRNVLSFLYRRDLAATIEDFGSVTFDVACGGPFNAVVDAGSLNRSLIATAFTQTLASQSYKSAISLAFALGAYYLRRLGSPSPPLTSRIAPSDSERA